MSMQLTTDRRMIEMQDLRKRWTEAKQGKIGRGYLGVPTDRAQSVEKVREH